MKGTLIAIIIIVWATVAYLGYIHFVKEAFKSQPQTNSEKAQRQLDIISQQAQASRASQERLMEDRKRRIESAQEQNERKMRQSQDMQDRTRRLMEDRQRQLRLNR